MKPAQRIIDILNASKEQEYIGEPISQLEHALQAGYWAQKAGAAEPLVLAALLHDIGHLCAPESAPRMAGLGVQHHENIGATLLRELGFSKEVQELVSGHVQAKRYLVARHPRYQGKLSEASKGTLEFQGGPMSEAEADAFERDPLFKAKLSVREWDERAKVVGLSTPQAEDYRAMLERHLSESQS